VIWGPIFTVELLTSGRRARFTLVRVAYAALLLLGLWITYETTIERYAAVSLRQAANVAGNFFHVFAWGQVAALLLVAPALTAGTIAEERERRTLDYLLASDLRDWEIVLGKYAARVLLTLWILLAGVPVLVISTLMGGVSPDQVWQVFIVAASTLLTVAAISLAISVRARRAREAIVGVYVILFAWFVMPLYGGMIWVAGPWPASLAWVRIMLRPLGFLLFDPNPIAALVKILYPSTPFVGGNPWRAVGWLVATQTIIIALCLARAIWGMRRVHIKLAAESRRRRVSLPRRPRPAVYDQAMRWKEHHAERSARLTPAARVAGALIALGVVAATIWAFVYAITTNARWGGMPWGAEYITCALYLGTLLACGGALLCGARAATSVTSERERDTWISLAVSPLEGREVVHAKMTGNLRATRGLWALLTVVWAPALVLTPLYIWALALIVLALVATLWFAAALGVWFSLRAQSSMRAIAGVLTVMLVVGGGFWFCCVPCLATMGPSGPDEILMLLAAPVIPFLLAFPGIVYLEGLSSFNGEEMLLIVAYWFGVFGYLGAATLVKEMAIDDFDRLAGRITLDRAPPGPRPPVPDALREAAPRD
jgi:ABC-type transport system involved in multi-copper enzyme maturation permease subunit